MRLTRLNGGRRIRIVNGVDISDLVLQTYQESLSLSLQGAHLCDFFS